MKEFLFNLTFFPAVIALTVVMAFIFTLPVLVYRLFMGQRRSVRLLRHLINFYGYIVVRIFMFPFVGVEFKDFGAINERSPFIYVSNHRSSTDAFLMVLLNGERVQVVNIWPFRIPILGGIAKLAGYLSINAMPFEEFLDKFRKLVDEGVSIIIFPEGSRSGSRTMGQFNGAAFRLAQQMRCPIVPVCITGNERIPSKGSFLFAPGTIKMHKMPTIAWEQFRDESPYRLKRRVRELIQKETELMEVAC